MNKPIAALYCRVSSRAQEDNYSLDSQLAGNQQYAQRLGFDVPFDPFVDVLTGTTLERPALDRIIELARAGKINAVVAYVQDRFARADALDVWNLTMQLFEMGVTVHAVDSGPLIQAPGLLAALPMLVKAVAARAESQKIGERTMRGRKARAAAGKIAVPFAKFGYSLTEDRTNYTINEEEAKVVVQIFDW